MDPITTTIISYAMNSIAQEMGVNLYQAARSTIIREVRDIATAIFDVEGNTVAMANWIPMLANAGEPAIQAIKKHYDLRAVAPDEVFLTNDPFDGGQHVNDILMFTPVHHDGEVVAFTCADVHHLDVGGAAPASYSGATEVFQEGIVLPPMKVRLGDDWVREPFGKFFLANIRAPESTGPDFEAQLAACRTGGKRVLALIEKYGLVAVLDFMRDIQLQSEQVARAAIAKIPNGAYSGEAFMEDDGYSDGPFTVRLCIHLNDSDIVVDFSGTDPQAKGFINIPLASTISTLRTTILSILGMEIRHANAGAFRTIRVEAPLGTLVNPRRPAATMARTSTCYKIFDAVNYALAPVLSKKVIAPGFDCQTGASFSHRGDDGSISIFSEALGAGNGALHNADGADGMIMHLTNAANTPIETVEIEHPFLTLLHYRLVAGSGGGGEFRGGMGIERAYLINRDNVIFGLHSDRHKHNADGLFGGLAGMTGRCWLERDGDTTILGSKVHTTLMAGDILHLRTGGGAGFGAPADRHLERIKVDQREERILRGQHWTWMQEFMALTAGQTVPS